MGFKDSYQAVFDTVKTDLQAVSSLKQVVTGEKFKLTKLPLAIINPMAAPILQATLQNVLEVSVNFDVILVVRQTEPADWFSDILAVMCDVVDKLLSDRTLNGKVKDLIPTEFTPGEVRFAAKIYYGGLISWQAMFFYEY